MTRTNYFSNRPASERIPIDKLERTVKMPGKVFVMRGVPRSGKTTWHKKNVPDALVVSANSYHYKNKNGVYDFKPENIRYAHNYSLKCFIDGPQANSVFNRPIVVDNTNIRMFEIAPYYRLAECLEREVEIVWCLCDLDTIMKRTNDHNVPDEVIIGMFKNFEAIPSWWNMRIVHTGS